MANKCHFIILYQEILAVLILISYPNQHEPQIDLFIAYAFLLFPEQSVHMIIFQCISQGPIRKKQQGKFNIKNN